MKQLINEDEKIKIQEDFSRHDFTRFSRALDDRQFALATEILQLANEEEASEMLLACESSQRAFIKSEIMSDYDMACQSGCVESLKNTIKTATLFKQRDLLFNFMDERLLKMAQNNQIEMMQTLLDFSYTYGNGPFNWLTNGTSAGFSVFQYAVNAQNMAMIQMIISTVKRSSGKNAFTSSSDSNLLGYLFIHTRDKKRNNAFLLAAQHGNVDVFNYLLEQAPQDVLDDLLKRYNTDGRSAFLLAKDVSAQHPGATGIMEKMRALDPKLTAFQEKMDELFHAFRDVISHLSTVKEHVKLDKEQEQQIISLAKELESYRQKATQVNDHDLIDWPTRMLNLKENCIQVIKKTELAFSEEKSLWNQSLRPLINKLIKIINNLLWLCRTPENQQLSFFSPKKDPSRQQQFSELTAGVVDKIDEIEEQATQYKNETSRKNSL